MPIRASGHATAKLSWSRIGVVNPAPIGRNRRLKPGILVLAACACCDGAGGVFRRFSSARGFLGQRRSAPNIRTAYGLAADGSDYAAKTAGHDPYLLSAACYATRLRFIADTSDTNVSKAGNTDLFRTLVAGTATESGLVTKLGGHLAGAANDPGDFVAFMKRCIAG